MQNLRRKLLALLRRQRPARVIVLVFAALILLGAVLLMLPVSSAEGQPTDFLTCLFTATSATCVTGLIMVDTGLHWSLFGKIVILLLIQTGGLGFMTILSIFLLALRQKLGLRQRMLLMQALSLETMQSVSEMVKRIIKGTLVIEGAGAVILAVRFAFDFDAGTAIWYGVFHSISAFCNAGFDILGDVALGGSISRYMLDPTVNLTLMALIVLGGLGFLVWSDVVQFRRTRRLSVYSVLVLSVTAALIVGGTVLTALAEWDNPATLGSLTFWQKILVSAFQSVTTRTAGFAAFPQQNMTDPGMAVSAFLMFIGGSSGSTAGGLKTVTFLVVVLSALGALRGRSRVSVLRRSIPDEQVHQAISLFLLMLGLVLVGAFVISISNGTPIMETVYETVSALATVGLTAGLSGSVNVLSHLILIVFMFFGRVGIMTISVGFMTAGREKERYAYADTKVLIG